MKPPTSDSHFPSNQSCEDELSQSAYSQDGSSAQPQHPEGTSMLTKQSLQKHNIQLQK